MSSIWTTLSLLLIVGQLCSSASIPVSTELPVPTYQNVVDHYRKEFLQFPCSNEVVVNQLFDVFAKFGDYDQDENAIEDAVAEMNRLTVVGNGLNISPKAWKSVQRLLTMTQDEPNVEMNFDSFVKDFELTSAQTERLHIITSVDRPYGEHQLYQDNFAIGVALGLPESEIKRVLDENVHKIVDIQTRIVVSKETSEELGALAEEKCVRKYNLHGYNSTAGNIVRDFLQALDALKGKSSEESSMQSSEFSEE